MPRDTVRRQEITIAFPKKTTCTDRTSHSHRHKQLGFSVTKQMDLAWQNGSICRDKTRRFGGGAELKLYAETRADRRLPFTLKIANFKAGGIDDTAEILLMHTSAGCATRSRSGQ